LATKVLLSLLLLLIACAGGGGAPKVDWEIKIIGAVSKPTTITYQDLAKKKMVALNNVLMQRSQGEDTTTNWEGPTLDEVLKEYSNPSCPLVALGWSTLSGRANQLVSEVVVAPAKEWPSDLA